MDGVTLIRDLYGGFETRDLKTPSAIVERQMLPRHTNNTLIGSGEAMLHLWSCCLLVFCDVVFCFEMMDLNIEIQITLQVALRFGNAADTSCADPEIEL